MNKRSKMARTIILAGIPLLTFPLLAESGTSRDRSDRMNEGRSNSMEQIIQGEISKKNGDEITLRASDGERITFRINDETNRLCQKGQISQSTQTSQNSSGQDQMNQGSSGQDSSNTGKTSSTSLFGSSSGQDASQLSSPQQGSSQKSGFAFGECKFEKGEFVKAKVDEDGNATFVRSMGQNDDNYSNAGRMGDEYFVLPAGQLGGLDISDKDANYSVKSSDGQEIGSVYRVMTNGNGDLTYAILRKKDGQLISVPWQALEGAGNKSFKLKVTQNQLGNLPILQEGENAGTHVQKHWDLTEQQRQNLAKWNERLDRFYSDRDRYYDDTPTFEGNREDYDRYDQRRSRMSRSGNDRPRHYQDQNAEDFQTRRDSFSPTEFPPHDRAFQYEGADQQDSYDRNRQGRSSVDYRNRAHRDSRYSGSQEKYFDNSDDRYDQRQSRSNIRNNDDFQNSRNSRSMYSQSREGNYRDPIDGLSDRYNTTTSRSQYDAQRQGADQYQSRRSGGKDYDYRPEGYKP